MATQPTVVILDRNMHSCQALCYDILRRHNPHTGLALHGAIFAYFTKMSTLITYNKELHG